MIDEEQVLDEIAVEDFEMEKEELIEEEHEVDEDSTPDFASKGWTEYVMSLLSEDEKFKDKPRTEGLLRIIRILFEDVEFPNPDVHHVSPEYAAVTCAILVNGRQFVGSAEVHPGNTDSPFVKYPLATAETRALGRAAKRLLGINILTAEETSKVADLTIPQSDEDRTEGGITATQIKMIARQSKAINVDVVQAVTNTVGQHDKISDLSHAEALRVLKQLDEWKRKRPEIELEDFNPNWEIDFN
jgi:hypothetical protein